MRKINKLLGIECIASLVFLLLVAFTMDENIVRTIVPLYGIAWIPAMFLSSKIYNNIIDSFNKES